MRVSRRRPIASSIALAEALGVSTTPFTFQQVDAASVPISQTIWLHATNNNNYVSAHTDQTNTPLEALVTQFQAWEEFDVVDAGKGLIALSSAHAKGAFYVQ